MVGKIKRVRPKLHQDAVKVAQAESGRDEAASLSEVRGLALPAIVKAFDVKQGTNQSGCTKAVTCKSSFPAAIFARTPITPEALVQTLNYEEPSKSAPGIQPGEKKQQSKKEKMKERRERWLNKISSIKLAKEQQLAQARRRATPVVGDMRPLADALPELAKLSTIPPPSTTTGTKTAKAAVKKKAAPVNLSRMKPAQKRKLVEAETAWFSQALKEPSLKASPLAAIASHLRKRLKQEEEQS